MYCAFLVFFESYQWRNLTVAQRGEQFRGLSRFTMNELRDAGLETINKPARASLQVLEIYLYMFSFANGR